MQTFNKIIFERRFFNINQRFIYIKDTNAGEFNRHIDRAQVIKTKYNFSEYE